MDACDRSVHRKSTFVSLARNTRELWNKEMQNISPALAKLYSPVWEPLIWYQAHAINQMLGAFRISEISKYCVGLSTIHQFKMEDKKKQGREEVEKNTFTQRHPIGRMAIFIALEQQKKSLFDLPIGI